MYFQPPRTSATPLFKSSSILKINDHINLQNFLLAYSSLKGFLPTSLQGNMNFLEHPHDTRNMGCLQLSRPSNKTIIYGSKSIKARSIEIWNFINKFHHEQRFLDKSLGVCKSFVKNLLLFFSVQLNSKGFVLRQSECRKIFSWKLMLENSLSVSHSCCVRLPAPG